MTIRFEIAGYIISHLLAFAGVSCMQKAILTAVHNMSTSSRGRGFTQVHHGDEDMVDLGMIDLCLLNEGIQQ